MQDLSRLLLLWGLLLAAAFAATAGAIDSERAPVFLVVVPATAVACCARRPIQSLGRAFTLAAAIVGLLASVHLWRRIGDPDMFLGPLPQQVETMVYAASLLITLVAAGLSSVAFGSERRLRRFRWPLLLLVLATLLALGLIARQAKVGQSPADILQLVLLYEQSDSGDAYGSQELSSLLAACGREAEAEAASSWRFSGGAGAAAPPSPLDISAFELLPWRQHLQDVARRERLIVIMEAHNAPRHRQWIEQALPVLHRAGFRDYAAETLVEPAQALALRGYPVRSTGYYCRDPSFGNLLRTAVELDFRFHAYESRTRQQQQREHDQAANLAKLFAANPRLKLVVHAGYAHVYKTAADDDSRTMAARLWKMTGIEPYSILQSWHGPQEHAARELSKLTAPEQEPVILAPPPAGLPGPQFRHTRGAVDAIVVHPPSTGGPAERVHSFPSTRRRISATWSGGERPVMIGAYKLGECQTAIALDQVMLREGENEFVLWVPDVPYEFRVQGPQGQLARLPASGSHLLKNHQR